MENKNVLPEKKQEGFFVKIKNFFKSMFYKDTNVEQVNDIKNEKTENDSLTSNFIDNLKSKTDVENTCEKETLEYIIEKVEENPQFLNELEEKQLENVDEYYDKKIQEVEKEINKIKNKD